jgi:hypothetical protein
MKNISVRLIGLVLAATLSGCKSGGQQLTPTQNIVQLTVTSTVAAGSTWVASKETVAAGTTSCDPPTSTNYKQINATPQASSIFDDATSAGSTVCEFMQYIVSGATSPASNVVGPLVVPANPTAPGVTATTTVQAAQSLPAPVTTEANPPVTASLSAPKISAPIFVRRAN